MDFDTFESCEQLMPTMDDRWVCYFHKEVKFCFELLSALSGSYKLFTCSVLPYDAASSYTRLAFNLLHQFTVQINRETQDRAN
jgi:hypothetical protein